jgi:hypothetical protein
MFSGAGCGPVSYGTVHVPRRAAGISLQGPNVGDALQDGQYDEGVVAHVTNVATIRNADGSFTARWTAVGSDAACDPNSFSSTGWSTEDETLTVDYQRDVGSRVYWRSLRNRPRDEIRPRWHSVLADVRFERMLWRSWGGAIAGASDTSVTTIGFQTVMVATSTWTNWLAPRSSSQASLTATTEG